MTGTDFAALLVFDNEMYGSTGSQASASRHVRLDHMARAAGYRHVAAVTFAAAIGEAPAAALRSEGPAFIPVKVTAEGAGRAADRAPARRDQGSLRRQPRKPAARVRARP